MPDYISPPATLAPGSVVWGYLRDSGGDAQEQSVPQQKAELNSYYQRFGLIIAHIFADIAKSGGSVVWRDAFLDMVDMSADAELRPDGLLLRVIVATYIPVQQDRNNQIDHQPLSRKHPNHSGSIPGLFC